MSGHLSERDTVTEKHRDAHRFRDLAAGRMRRRAQTITLAMNFRVPGVGAVLRTLKLKPGIHVGDLRCGRRKNAGPVSRRASIWVGRCPLHIRETLVPSA